MRLRLTAQECRSRSTSADEGAIHRCLRVRTGATVAVFIFVYVTGRFADAVNVRVSSCIAKRILDIPCPGCGVTTSIRALLSGDTERALSASIAGPFVVGFFVANITILFLMIVRTVPDRFLVGLLRLSDRSLTFVLLTSWLVRLLNSN